MPSAFARPIWVSHDGVNDRSPSRYFAFGRTNGAPQVWTSHNAGKSYSCATRADGKLLRLELRSGEQWASDVQRRSLVERTMVQAVTEIGSSQSAILPLAADVWWAFSFLLEPGAPVSGLGRGYEWLVFADIHSNYATTHATNIPIQFEILPGDILGIQIHGDQLSPHPNYVYRSNHALSRGVWHDMVMRIDIDPANASGRGGVTVWLDREMIYRYDGPLGFARDLPYAQYQIYRGNPEPMTLRHETLTICYANHDLRTHESLARRIVGPPAFPYWHPV